MLQRILFFIIILFFISCDKEIQLPLDPNASILVIDASITDEPGPYFVKLSKSIDIGNTAGNPLVNNASVIISDNQGQRDTLKQNEKGLHQTKKIKGVYGNTYFLEVIVEGKKYTATSTVSNTLS